jgi:hypothetical protein
MARRRGTIGRREHPQPRPSGMQGTCSSAVAGDPVNQRARRFSFSRTVVSHLDAEPKFCAVASGSPVEPRRLEYPQRCAQSLLVLCGGWTAGGTYGGGAAGPTPSAGSAHHRRYVVLRRHRAVPAEILSFPCAPLLVACRLGELGV